MRNIDKFVVPMENVVIWSGGFTPEECDSIIQHGELAEFKQGSIGNGEVNNEVRNTKITWIEPTEDAKWIFEKMNTIISKVNFDKFQLKLSRFDGFQYSKYDIDCHYDWHTDVFVEPRDGLFRKLSISLMLTDQEEYTGGEFVFNETGNQEKSKTASPKKGDIVVFYSHIPHKVTPVETGTRITLVTWALGEKIV